MAIKKIFDDEFDEDISDDSSIEQMDWLDEEF